MLGVKGKKCCAMAEEERDWEKTEDWKQGRVIQRCAHPTQTLGLRGVADNEARGPTKANGATKTIEMKRE
jgi:hypothetical protein